MPLPHSGYCPSHQHLGETEELEAPLAAQAPCRGQGAREGRDGASEAVVQAARRTGRAFGPVRAGRALR